MCGASAAGFSRHRGFWNLVWGPRTCVEAQFHCSRRSVWDRVVFHSKLWPTKMSRFYCSDLLKWRGLWVLWCPQGNNWGHGSLWSEFSLAGQMRYSCERWAWRSSSFSGQDLLRGGGGDCLPEPDRGPHHHSHQLYCKLASQIQMLSLTPRVWPPQENRDYTCFVQLWSSKY